MKHTLSFNAWSRKRLADGRKCLTSRKRAYVNDPIVKYILPPLPWWFIREYLYRDEGAESPEELERVITSIFRRKVGLNEEFYVHVLRKDML